MKFSIAISAYKIHFLKECIDSILSQTCTDFELIILNDQSPYAISELVRGYLDKRIVYFENKSNVGAENLPKNWNSCLKIAKGEFFIMMGDDDKMEPEFLEEFAKLIAKYPTLSVYHCRSKIIDEHSKPFMLTPSWPEYESVYDNIWHRLKGFRIQFISDFVYRTSALKKHGGFIDLPLAWGSDDVTAFMMAANQGIAHLNEPVFNYRKTRYTISSSGDVELKIKALDLYHSWLTQFLSRVPAIEQHRIVWSELQNVAQTFVLREKQKLVFNDIRKRKFRCIHRWYLKRTKYNLNAKNIFYAAIGKF